MNNVSEYKPRVVFPFVEAGLGHIMPEKSVADVFQAKYGKYCDIIRTRFFNDTKEKTLIDYEHFLVRQVQLHNIVPFYGHATEIFGRLWGSKISNWFVMRALSRGAYKVAVDYMRDLSPDLVFNTHWSTAYYANKLEKRPLVVSFCPDVNSNVMFDARTDMLILPAKTGYDKCLRNTRRYNQTNIFNSTFPIRQEAYQISKDKSVNRKMFGISDDAFTVVLADGAYGLSKLKKMTEKLIQSDIKMTIIPVCGKNEKLYKYFLTLKAKDNIDFKPMFFCENMLNLTACCDVYSGKSGANAMLEPCFFNIPTIITKCVTFIERGNMKFYTEYVGNSIYEPNTKKAVKLIERLSADKEYYNKLYKNSFRLSKNYGAESIADKLWEMLKTKFQLSDKNI
ncbi:MAG: hypothetical protein RRY18_01260 [Clostridia bacterium]